MIFYLVTREHAYTIAAYLASWGKDMADRVRPVFYDDLDRQDWHHAATVIFSDLERLDPSTAERCAQLWHDLHRQGVRLLNHPTRSLRRYELLRTLYTRGWNRFDVFRLVELRQPQRYPVFLRGECDHYGPYTQLLGSPDLVAAAYQHMFRAGVLREGKLLVEFCDTADREGIYRKYSAFIVGDRIIPRHLFFSRSWMVKKPELVDEAKLIEEREYLETNPHAAQLRDVFALANIQYARVDYAFYAGQMQVWEINTNPESLFAIPSTSEVHQQRLALHAHFDRHFREALQQLAR